MSRIVLPDELKTAAETAVRNFPKIVEIAATGLDLYIAYKSNSGKKKHSAHLVFDETGKCRKWFGGQKGNLPLFFAEAIEELLK